MVEMLKQVRRLNETAAILAQATMDQTRAIDENTAALLKLGSGSMEDAAVDAVQGAIDEMLGNGRQQRGRGGRGGRRR